MSRFLSWHFWLSDSQTLQSLTHFFLNWVQKSELRLLSYFKSPFWFKTKNFDKCLTSDSDIQIEKTQFFLSSIFCINKSLIFTLINSHLFLHAILFFKIALCNSLFIPRWYKIGIYFLLRCIFYQICLLFSAVLVMIYTLIAPENVKFFSTWLRKLAIHNTGT